MIEPSYLTDFRPIRDQQIETLNQALSGEVLRHARTRLLNLLIISLIPARFQPTAVDRVVERIVERPVMVEVEKVVIVYRDAPKARARRAPPDTSRGLQRSQIPVVISEREGLAAVIQTPVLLRSGVIVHPDGLVMRSGDTRISLTDASWLALCAMVQAGGRFVALPELNSLIFGGKAAESTIRTAIYRARRAIHDAGGESGDIEGAKTLAGGWRLRLAKDVKP